MNELDVEHDATKLSKFANRNGGGCTLKTRNVIRLLLISTQIHAAIDWKGSIPKKTQCGHDSFKQWPIAFFLAFISRVNMRTQIKIVFVDATWVSGFPIKEVAQGEMYPKGMRKAPLISTRAYVTLEINRSRLPALATVVVGREGCK